MRSTDTARRRQSGQSLVEGIVASALIAVAVAAGMQTLEAAMAAARTASSNAWGRCVARGELTAIGSAAWSDTGYAAPPGVTATVVWTSVPDGQLQKVVVTVTDGPNARSINPVTPFQIYKAKPLAGASPLSSSDTEAIEAACLELRGR